MKDLNVDKYELLWSVSALISNQLDRLEKKEIKEMLKFSLTPKLMDQLNIEITEFGNKIIQSVTNLEPEESFNPSNIVSNFLIEGKQFTQNFLDNDTDSVNKILTLQSSNPKFFDSIPHKEEVEDPHANYHNIYTEIITDLEKKSKILHKAEYLDKGYVEDIKNDASKIIKSLKLVVRNKFDDLNLEELEKQMIDFQKKAKYTTMFFSDNDELDTYFQFIKNKPQLVKEDNNFIRPEAISTMNEFKKIIKTETFSRKENLHNIFESFDQEYTQAFIENDIIKIKQKSDIYVNKIDVIQNKIKENDKKSNKQKM
jgi:hypothetical protein